MDNMTHKRLFTILQQPRSHDYALSHFSALLHHFEISTNHKFFQHWFAINGEFHLQIQTRKAHRQVKTGHNERDRNVHGTILDILIENTKRCVFLDS